jgi:hypothetical protein
MHAVALDPLRGPRNGDPRSADGDLVINEEESAADALDRTLEAKERTLDDGDVGVVGVRRTGEVEPYVVGGLLRRVEGDAVDPTE